MGSQSGAPKSGQPLLSMRGAGKCVEGRDVGRDRKRHGGGAVALLALAKLALHCATAGQYGVFRDELYYLACARHLAAGYVDQPPLIAFVTWFAAHVFGTSLLGLRLLPALAGASLVWLTALVARELGGKGFAQCMAAFSILPVPIYLMLDHWLTMNAFEAPLWTLTLWLALRMCSTNDPRFCVPIGCLVGIGLENKYSMLLFAGALVLGLILTSQQWLLRSRWFVVGCACTLLLFLPNLLWLVHNHFPFLTFEQHSRMSAARIERAPLAFIADQAMITNPLLAPLWFAGLLWLLWSKRAARYRFAGWTSLAILLVLLVLKAKNYYAAPIYPALFAGGAVALEAATQHKGWWLRSAYGAAVLAAGLILAPFVLPVLPIGRFLAYQQAFGGFTPVRLEKQPPGLLPQQFADEFGWEEMARKTAAIYERLPDAAKSDTAIFGNNYGEAAAIDFFGARYGLPAAISGSESFWLWGPRGYSGKTMIVLGSNGVGDREHFATVEKAGRMDDPYTRDIEHFDFYLCRDLAANLGDFWPETKKW